MGKSARILGEENGLSAQEMNFLLKEEGFLDGGPGDYELTEKGKLFGQERDFHRGTGGYAHYNRYWTTRTWDDSVVDEMDLSAERITELRQAMDAAKQKIKEASDSGVALDLDSISDEINSEDGDTDLVTTVLLVLLGAAAAFGVYKAYPPIKRWWISKAYPKLIEIKNNVFGQSKSNAENENEITTGNS